VTSWRIERFEELGSTSDLCINRAKAGEAAGLVVTADRQVAGRGSRGRQWQAPAGNLNLSVLLRPSQTSADSGIFSLLAGVAVAGALGQSLPSGTNISLKWPNDVLVAGAKIAGILVDASSNAQGIDWLVIGIGINIAHAPEIAGRLTTTLHAHGGSADAPAMGAILLQRLSALLDILATSGKAAISDAWLRLAHPVGTAINITSAQGVIAGTFAGLSPAGELLLNRDGRIDRISTGEVLLTPVMD
jgi:BirA family biotin operon repressor/biotin-[acetyl-CoA-carboxylase] ligase